ncbi:hypothetical protein FRB96_001577 [Tulasnella sp. 330]|nr:hypothetical protein FRB96_001577 [Tulasnella sp. 330]
MPRRKALLIGINYTGTDHALQGCINDVHNMRDFLVQEHGYHPADMVTLTDDQNKHGVFYPNGRNMMKGIKWLVEENSPGDSLFLHYSGHGGQVPDPDGDRESSFDDTIVPVDFETNGQLDSDMMDNVKEAASLYQSAQHLVRGFALTPAKLQEAKELFAGAQNFLKGFQNRGRAKAADVDAEGLGEEHFIEPWAKEGKDAWMFSGCRDDQTSADTSISGAHVGGPTITTA